MREGAECRGVGLCPAHPEARGESSFSRLPQGSKKGLFSVQRDVNSNVILH